MKNENPTIELPELPHCSFTRSFSDDYINAMGTELFRYITSLILLINENDKKTKDKQFYRNPIELFDTITIFLHGWSFLNNRVRGINDYSSSSKMELITIDSKINPNNFNEIIYLQEEKCVLCGKELHHNSSSSSSASSPNNSIVYCYYTHLYYCSDCISKEKMIIPSYVLCNWNFERYTVCLPVYEYIKSIYNKPIINISMIDPQVMFSEQLDSIFGEIKEYRRNLGKLNRIVSTCNEGLLLFKELKIPNHLIVENDNYSLEDIEKISNFNKLKKEMKYYKRELIHHIRDCENCRIKINICLICNNKESIIYGYGYDNYSNNKSVECKKCKELYHKECFDKSNGICLNCNYSNKNVEEDRNNQHDIYHD